MQTDTYTHSETSTFKVKPNRFFLTDHPSTLGKLRLNYQRNKKQDQTAFIDAAAQTFDYKDCANSYWNPPEFSLLYGTRLWEEASEHQRLILNQLYWVAYYTQIISAEIATIFFNQTSAAGLYAIDDFRLVCDSLDLESAQERAHINAFKVIGEKTEDALLGERLFTYPMRGPYVETMIFHNSGRVKEFWRGIQLRAFNLLSSGYAFIGCQYFLIRGLRTLNGKLVQHQLSRFYQNHPTKEQAPIPAKVSFYHFLDESFHFNSSTIIGREIVRCLPKPTAFEKMVINKALRGCQKDHSTFSTAINGLFWYDPALYPVVYRILRSKHFHMNREEALRLMSDCFTKESEGLSRSAESQKLAMESYRAYLDDLDHIAPDNRSLEIMARYHPDKHLRINKHQLEKFAAHCH